MCLSCVVWVSCLKAIRRLQRFGHLPSDASVFKSYAVDGNFSDVRLAALEALVDFTAGLFALFTRLFVVVLICGIATSVLTAAFTGKWVSWFLCSFLLHLFQKETHWDK